MSRSSLRAVKPTAIYDLAEVFEAVRNDRDACEAQLKGRPEWAQNWPPAATARALGAIMDQLAEWRAMGVTQIITDAPFADGNLTGPVEDMITEQFLRQRVQPCEPAKLLR